MASVAQLTEQIALKQSQKAALLQEAQQLEASAAALRADGDNDKIRAAHRKADEAERSRKYNLSDSYKATAAAKRNEAARIDQDIAALNSQIVALGQAEQELARQGTSSSALETIAMGQAQAAVTTAQITSEAQARSIDAETDRNKVYMYIGIAVLGVTLIGLAIYVAKKIKKKKSKNK